MEGGEPRVDLPQQRAGHGCPWALRVGEGEADRPGCVARMDVLLPWQGAKAAAAGVAR